jgi:hypothetical protein
MSLNETQPRREFEPIGMTRFENSEQFLTGLLHDVNHAGPADGILLITMTLYACEATNTLMNACIAKKIEGNNVKVCADAISRVTSDSKPHARALFFPPFALTQHQRSHRQNVRDKRDDNRDLFDRMEKAGILDETHGVKTHHHLLPEIGRNHIKLYKVGDTWRLCTSNLDSRVGQNVDLSFTTDDKEFDTSIKTLKTRILSDHTEDNEEIPGKKWTVTFDGGRRNDSLIYDNALRDIEVASQQDSTEPIYFVSQYLPDRKMRKIIKNSKRPFIILSNDPELVSAQPLRASMNTSLKAIQEMENVTLIMSKNPNHYVHTKAWYTGEEAELGSNNYHQFGVAAGTKEIAVRFKDPALLAEFKGKINEDVKRVQEANERMAA